ncbi:MAG: hypothetical protein B6244_00520 [Candidatus Cloacimonetes bacterium 4572_55]|nr:MAG: hypothetical protein B6244_00520 [Candidatus Cloacimonetes bacterium 4572_55]
MNRKMLAIFIILSSCSFLLLFEIAVFAENPPQFGDLEPGPYAVGYEVISVFDYSRTFDTPKYNYKGEFQEGDRARPITLHIWYPAQKSDDNVALPYSEYFTQPFAVTEGELSEERQAEIIQTTRGIMGPEVEEAKYNEIMATPTALVKNPVRQDGEFPLIIIAPGFNQRPSAHTVQGEYLASHGYIVASSASQGERGAITYNLLGANAQLRDMEFIRGYMYDYEHLDKDKLGVAGFSFGGVASALMMMKNTDVDAFLSLDSVIGTGGGFGAMFQSPYYHTTDIRAAVMHLWTDPDRGTFNPNFLNSLTYANTYIIKLENMRHYDFISFGKISAMVPGFAPFGGEVRGDAHLAQTIVNQYALNFFDAYVKRDKKALTFLGNKPTDNGFPADVATADIREVENPPPGERDVIDMIMNGEIEGAVKIFKRFQDEDPELEIFQEGPMNNLGYQLVGQQRVDDALEVFKLNVEAYPDSWNCYDSLAEAYNLKGNTEKAIEFYSIALEMNPEDPRITGILNNLKNSKDSKK